MATFETSYTVTADCIAPTEEEVTLWKKGEMMLYVAHIFVSIKKVVPLTDEECRIH